MNSKSTVIFIATLFFTFSSVVNAQTNAGTTVSKSYYKNGFIAREFFLNAKQQFDSIKTYHIEGGIDEKFYFTENSLPNGVCEKFSQDGKLITTWLYKNGELIRRTDYEKEFNLKNEATFETNLKMIVKCNAELKSNPENLELLYNRAIARLYLKDNVLAEFDLLHFKSYLENLRPTLQGIPKEEIARFNANLAEVYSRLSTLYGRFENDNLSIEYKLKAVETEPTETRHLFNVGAYLATEAQDYRLAFYYLNEVVRRVPNHNFANWVLGYSYLEMEEYQKAVDCINLAFENEDNLYVNGYGTEESDLRTIRGLAYHKLGKTELAKKDLNEALKINEKNSVANKYLGIIYADLGEKQKSCSYFQKSKELGYEKKYYNKSLDSYIKNSCGNAIAKTSKTNLQPKDLPYIAPNPAEKNIEILNYSYANFNFEIFDVSGKRVANGKSANKSIQVSTLPSGLYILNIEKEGKTETFKLIKK